MQLLYQIHANGYQNISNSPAPTAPIEPDFVQQCTGISEAFWCLGDFLLLLF
ncbi:MAG: hypothetical protein Q8J85_02980 [Sulfuricurvum sp.]|nr:hypothetical protein [Sulfuricurvum sp.]MDP3023087.1 hypothetical protein [Sulfuricurvum sp.]